MYCDCWGAGTACTPALPAPLAAKLRAPYREDCGHWEAVLALHRLSVVTVYSFGGADSAVAAVLQTLLCVIALMVHQTWQPFHERSANRAQTALLSCLVAVALLNVPQAILDTNALAESRKMKQLIEQLQGGEAVLLLAPAALVGAALAALAWHRRHELAGCAALARCPGATASTAAGLCAAPCGGEADEADEEAPLEEPLLGGAKLVSNSRGLRLTHHTPTADSDGDDGEGSTA